MASTTKTIDIAFVGAGAIHFGGAEGPWNHSARLEQLNHIRVIAIVDPDQPKAKVTLDQKLKGIHKDMYKQCKLYKTTEDMLKDVKPGAVFLGIPPIFRGSHEPNKDLELSLVRQGVHLFVEKPMSVIFPDDFTKYATAVEDTMIKSAAICSVGYMFRYHAAVIKMKELIAKHGGKVMLFNARYYIAYTKLDHPFWWNINKSGGPIVEQATHFCDLARFLVGDVELNSVQTMCLRDQDAGGAGKINHVPAMCEENITEDQRIPRVTISTWRFQDGGLGTLSHAIALHGEQYETSLEVVLDGLRMTLYEPYTKKCKLLVRDGRTESDAEIIYDFGDDDPYMREIGTFLDAIRSGSSESIACSYNDAAKTYQFSWAIRLAGEK